MKFSKSPFKFKNILPTWISFETQKYRIGVQFGDYKEFYIFEVKLLNKMRYCFRFFEVITVRKTKN